MKNTEQYITDHKYDEGIQTFDLTLEDGERVYHICGRVYWEMDYDEGDYFTAPCDSSEIREFEVDQTLVFDMEGDEIKNHGITGGKAKSWVREHLKL